MKIKITNLSELENFAKSLSKLLNEGDVVSLIGNLGAGKTTLVQMVGKELGVDDYITSPTFSIVNIYQGDRPIYHLDLYRLEDPDELLQIDYEDYFYPEGITFIEWAEMGGDYLPDQMIEINIIQDEDARHIELVENNYRAKEIGERLNENFSN